MLNTFVVGDTRIRSELKEFTQTTYETIVSNMCIESFNNVMASESKIHSVQSVLDMFSDALIHSNSHRSLIEL